MEEPPKLEEPLDESDTRHKRLQTMGQTKDDELEEKFYKYVKVLFAIEK